MSELPEDPLAEGVCYEEGLPLTWRRLEAPVDSARWHELNARNEAALRLLCIRMEGPRESTDEQASSHELAQIDFKLSLLMDLVGELLVRQLEMPVTRRVRLGSQGLLWEGPEGQETRLAVGDRVLVTVYLDPYCPRPVAFPGRVYRSEQVLDLDYRAGIVLEGLSETVQDWLDRFIFRHHRRRIAQARTRRPAD